MTKKYCPEAVYDFEAVCLLVCGQDQMRVFKFRIRATVDAVQTHNGADAMMSAWGNNDMITVGDDAEE